MSSLTSSRRKKQRLPSHFPKIYYDLFPEEKTQDKKCCSCEKPRIIHTKFEEVNDMLKLIGIKRSEEKHEGKGKFLFNNEKGTNPKNEPRASFN